MKKTAVSGTLKNASLSDFAKKYKTALEGAFDLKTNLKNGKLVSTVRLSSFYYKERPYETMVFPKHGDWLEIDCERYATEKEARAGHKAMAAKWRNRK